MYWQCGKSALLFMKVHHYLHQYTLAVVVRAHFIHESDSLYFCSKVWEEESTAEKLPSIR